MSQLSLLPQAHALKDVVYTNDEVAKDIISHFQPSGYLLDPCKGDGAFYNNFPANCEKAYCEIDEGKDFYNFVSKVNWVVGNPPYSIFHEFLKHAFSISENVVFLVPTNKVFQSWKTMSLINKWGGWKVFWFMVVVILSAFLLAFQWALSTFKRVTRAKLSPWENRTEAGETHPWQIYRYTYNYL